jgi:hypothetical protein
MQWWQTLVMVSAFLLVDSLIIFVVVPAVIRDSWGTIATAHPSIREPFDRTLPEGVTTPATWRGYQSLSAGLVNMGGCMHIGVDDWGVHFQPTFIARLFRMPPASVPWEAMTPQKKGWRTCRVMIRGVTVKGPTWTLGRLWDKDQPSGGGQQ